MATQASGVRIQNLHARGVRTHNKVHYENQIVYRFAGYFVRCSPPLRLKRAASVPERANDNTPRATIIVNEQFLNSFLVGMFDNLQEPSMPLTAGGAQSAANCASEIRLKREVNGVRTAVHFENGRIVGPLAFSGAYYSSLLGCVEFTGWADAEVTMEFSRERRAVLARFQVRDIHLNNTPGMLNEPLRNMVQEHDRPSLQSDRTVHPRTTLNQHEHQAGRRRSAFGSNEVRPEITPNELALHITYRFVRG